MVRQPPRRLGGLSRVAALAAVVALGLSSIAEKAEADDARDSATPSTCPEPEAVWTICAKIVPAAASDLIAARPLVEIADLGDQYRVRVETPTGALERTYSDPERNCDRRARFAAEFIVLALMPPQLASEAPPPPPPPPQMAPREPERGSGKHVLRIDVGAVGDLAPSFPGSPAILAWGAELRMCVGSGLLAPVAGVGYLPPADFVLSSLHGSVTRIPIVIGLRLRAARAEVEVAGDLSVGAALERYSGTGLATPRDAARVAPEIDAALQVSTRSFAGLAPFASLRFALAPVTNGLGSTPEGVVGKTPSLWMGVALGVSLIL